MRAALMSAGFKCYTESKYISSDSYLIAGDIILNDSQHVAIQVTDGTYGLAYNTDNDDSEDADVSNSDFINDDTTSSSGIQIVVTL